MDPTIGTDNTTDLSYFQTKGRILKRLLHLAPSKRAEITVCVMRRAVRVLPRKLSEFILLVVSAVDLALVLFEDGNGFFLRTRDIGLEIQLGPDRYGTKTEPLTSFQLDGRLLSLCFTRR